MTAHQRSDTIMEDYCDGANYKGHPLFTAHPSALQIILYYDDVEVVNPLGSRTKKHKLGRKNVPGDAIVANNNYDENIIRHAHKLYFKVLIDL